MLLLSARREAIRTVSASDIASHGPEGRTPTILVVDDEVLIRMALSDCLQDSGYKVLEAGNADEAVAVLEHGHEIDLVFSDIRMPGTMDGFGLAKWIRQNRNGLPVLLTSGDSKKSDLAEQLGGDEPFFAKPYDTQTILAQIRQSIDARKR
jgi:CheY-like chemotaxis protein